MKNKNIKNLYILLLIVFTYLLYKKQILSIFNSKVLPLLSDINFSMVTHIIFFAICCVLCCHIFKLLNRRYHISNEGLCYAVLAVAIYAEHRIWGPYYTIPDLFWGVGYMDIIMIILGVSTMLFILQKVLPKKTNKSTSTTNQRFLLDYPIKDDDDDLLDYKSSAHMLAEKIKSIDTKHSCSIGLIAPWGMGKTSYLNILSNHFDKDSYIILRFNPRHSISSENIQIDFFNLLFSTLGKYDSRFNSTFKDYLKAINIITDDNLTSKMLNLHKIWDKEVEKEEVNEAIQNINKRIIVFIDDFDRLLRDEIIEVFKLIDGNASFTNLIFVSAYDKEYVNTIIECEHSQYNSFADKFFTIEVHLPLRPYGAIYNYLLDNISTSLNLSEEKVKEYNNIIGPHLDVVQRYLPTIRDVKRFLNIFIHRFATLHEEVIFKDYFFLSLIRYRFIDEYCNLRDGYYVDIDIKKGFNQLYVKDDVSCKSIDVLNILFSENMIFRSINNKAAFNIYFYESVVAGLKIEDMKQMFTFPTLDEAYKYINNIYEKNLFPDFLAYIENANIVGFNDFSSFERYIDIVMYILSTDKGSLYTNIAAFDLIYKRSAEQVCKNYNIQESKYKEFLTNKLLGNHPLYPYQLIRDIIHAFLNKELTEDTILNVDEIIKIAKDSLLQLCEKEPIVSQQHLKMLYNCIHNINPHTKKVILDNNLCKHIGQKIREIPAAYFENFVRLGGVSSNPDFNTIACEPFWHQIFGEASSFESFINELTKETVPNILCVKNFWELYKANGYTPIEYNNQGDVQAKINNELRDEINKLKRLQEIEEEFDEFLFLQSENKEYIEQYDQYLTEIDNIGLYVKFKENLRKKILKAITEKK